MPNGAVDLVRRAYEAYAQGDVASMMRYVAPDLEWTFLDPTLEDPAPNVCHGRHELEIALERQAKRGLRSELVEVIGRDDRVMVAMSTPGVDAYRVRKGNDLNYDVLTVAGEVIIAMSACRDREEALTVAGIE